MEELRYRILEHVTRVAPFGVRFYDLATGRYPEDLLITLERAPRKAIDLHAGPSAVYSAQGFPGLAGFEHADDYESAWEALPMLSPTSSPAEATAAYVLTVTDPLGRYLPFALTAEVPHRGLFSPPCPISPPEWPAGSVPLFPTAARSVPAGMAAIRAELWDLLSDRPAAGAVLTARYDGGVLGRGIADTRGRLLAIIPYPPPIDFLPNSPATGASAFEQKWTLDLQVAYMRAVLSPPEADAPRDLCAILQQLSQPAATIWQERSPDIALTQADLEYRKDLALYTRDAGRRLPRLLITPAA